MTMTGRSEATHRQKPQLLVNYLRHAGTHNKVLEEREMWRLRGLERKSQYERLQRPERGSPLTRGRLLSDSFGRYSRSPSPPPKDHGGEGGSSDHRGESPSGYYWTQQLMKAEERDPFRWGHSGYKELHPEEFESPDEDAGEKKRKRKRASSRTKKNREIRKKKRKKERGGESTGQRKKRRKRDYDSSSEEDSGSHRKRKRRKGRHNSDKKFTCSQSQGSSSELSDSDEVQTRRKRRREKSLTRDNKTSPADLESSSTSENGDKR